MEIPSHPLKVYNLFRSSWIKMITICLLVLIGTILWKVGRSKHSTNLPPGPISLPLIGSLYVFRNKRKRPYEILTELSKVYGPIFGLQMGSIYTVVLTDPTLIREALRRDEYSGRAPLYLTHGIMGGKGESCVVLECPRRIIVHSSYWLSDCMHN